MRLTKGRRVRVIRAGEGDKEVYDDDDDLHNFIESRNFRKTETER